MFTRVLALLVAVVAIAAACSGSANDNANNVDETKETIRLVANPWSASRLNVEVAKGLIEAELGNPVEIVEVDELDAMFSGMADGTLDAVLEIWPSAITDTENKFFDDGLVEELGALGAVGRVGWFVPRYVIEESPALASWQGYVDPANARLFSTDETGDRGRFLGIDPAYSEFDEQIIQNLDLPFDVQFSGSEPETLAELDERVEAGEPLLMYWWEPTAATSTYDLVQVDLPPSSEACRVSRESEDGDVDCAYPEDVMFKAVSPALSDKDADVYAFLSAFTMTNADQLSMLPAMEIEGGDPAEVAQAWIDANPDTWQEWLPNVG